MDFYKAKYSDKKFDRHSKSPQFQNRNSRTNEPLRSYRNSGDKRKPEMHKVTCADCGNKCQIPFEPKFNRPVYCSECFQKNKPEESRDKYPRNERNSSPDTFRTSRSKSTKFLKKTESFYSNGSEKFYSSLKEKLFEILGGKVCSSCGFKDERALGFNHVNDEDAFDSIRRGGFASSWGKYISEPELARKDLRVLCLNCNEIRQPTKTESKSKTPNKKSRYFPR
ncbi:MAG: hypothetical protein K8Q89_08580 [Nitrosarchaeum sp.]|nr:hypothetical protein [Nitrosarchaeum sp.]